MPPSRSGGNEHEFLAARLRITPALELRVLAQRFEGGSHVHIREFALTNENTYVATPRGINLPVGQLNAMLDAVRELRSMDDREGVAATLPASGGRFVRFSIAGWQGLTKADIRFYFQSQQSGKLLPTKKGVRVNLGLLAEVERSLEALDRKLNG